MGSPSFTKKVIEQNGYDLYCYTSDDGEVSIEIFPEKALISDIKLKGQSIICGPKSNEDFSQNTSFKSSYLTPFPNRLKGGKYEFDGNTFQFPINDEPNQNALHGFNIDAPFKLMDESAQGSLRLSFVQEYLGENACFPFPFSFNVIMTIDQFKFELIMQIQNIGDKPMPIGMGWHPYFTLQNKIDNCALCIPNCKKIEVDERKIPTGKRTAYKEFSKSKLIGDAHFDTAYLFEKDADFTSVTLESDLYKLRYYQETRDTKFNYLQIYTPEDRESIALEPMSCNIDAFNNQEGLRILAPRKRFKAKCGVAITKK